MTKDTYHINPDDQLESMRRELEDLKYKLEDANETIDAIRNGNVDAIVVKLEDGHHLYTLKTADHAYRIFIEQMTEGALTLSQTGQILYCNSQFSHLTCVPLEKIVGQPFTDFIPDQDVEQSKNLIDNAWKESNRGELNLLCSGKEDIPVLLSLKTLDLDGGPSLSIIVTDLSSQKHTQHLLEQKNIELQEAQRKTRELNSTLEHTVTERTRTLEYTLVEKTKIEGRLTQILETMAEGVGIVDTEGNLSYANPMAQKILGFHINGHKENFYNNPKWKNLYINGNQLPEAEHPLYISIKTGQPVYDQEIAVQVPGKELFYISINAAPIFDENGVIVAAIGTFMDVTNRRKALQQKDDFISVASHELRTPISTLKATLQLLNRVKNDPNSSMIPVLVEQSNKSLEKVTSLINDLLNVSKMSQGQLHLNRSWSSLTEIVQQSIDSIHPKLGHDISFSGGDNLQVFADPDRVEQVVTNMINNAIKYAPDSKRIEITISEEAGMAKVVVRDYGPGIPDEKIPHLFERFYRVDDKGNKYSGFGLGLYICAEIVRKHAGKIGVDSKLNQGSRFWFSLPLGSQPLAEQPNA